MGGKAHQQDFSHNLRAYLGQLAENPYVHRQRPESFNVRVAHWKGLRIDYLLQEDERRMIIVAFVGRNRLIENCLSGAIKNKP